jgi:hypothetical protein
MQKSPWHKIKRSFDMKQILIGFIVSLLWVGCSSEEYLPLGYQLIANTNLSSAGGSILPWQMDQSGSTNMGVSKEIFFTGNQSLFIENQDSTMSGTGTWTQKYTGPMPAPGSSLELTAFLKGEEIRNFTPDRNIFIYFKVFTKSDGSGANYSASNQIKFGGNFDWTPLTARLESFPKDAQSVQVYLFMPSLLYGKIYFDEIQLRVKNN